MPSQAVFFISTSNPGGLGDFIHQVDVESDDILVLIDELHGRPCGIRGYDDFGGFLGAGGEARRAEHYDNREKNEGDGR